MQFLKFLSRRFCQSSIAFIVLILLCCEYAYPQEPWKQQRNILLKQLAESTNDKQKADRLFAVGANYEANNTDSARYYYAAAGKLSDKIGYNIGKLRYMACMSEVLETRAHYSEALSMCLRGVGLAKKINNRHLLAGAYNNTAVIYDDLGDREKTLEYYQQAIALYENLKTKADSANLATVYGNVLSIYLSLELTDKAHAYGIKAVAFSRATKNNDALLVALANLSTVLIKMNRCDTALLLINQQYDLSKKLNDKGNELNALGNMCTVLLNTGKTAGVKQKAGEMLLLAKTTGDINGMGNANYFLARYYFELKDYKSAGVYGQRALKIFSDNKINNIDIHLLISDIALATGNMTAYNLERNKADSLRDKEVSGKILKYNQELRVKYEVEKKELEITNLHEERKIQRLTLTQQKMIITVLAGSAILIIMAGFLYFRYSRQKNKVLVLQDEVKQQRITELENEKKLHSTETILRSQEEERKRIARDLHDGLGGILSGAKFSLSSMKQNFILTEENAMAFERTMEMLDLSITELRRVAHNMMPETLLKLTFDEALADYCQQINNSSGLQVTYQSFGLQNINFDNTIKITVYRITQELISNIVKHASATTAMVQLIFNGTELNMTVEDNGTGFDVESLHNARGIGYKSLLSRVDFLAGKIDIQSARGKGTTVYILIPFAV